MDAPYLETEHVTIYQGDCLEVMATTPDASVDAIITDPPYGLGFMGRKWDALPPGLPWAKECLRILKPGGHVLAFGGSRTWHRLAVAIEDAGFEVRDSIAWLYGSGFPKGHNLKGDWQGWGTSLKPAFEPILMARKPLDGTVAGNVTRWGTGALNIDATRVGRAEGDRTEYGRGNTLAHANTTSSLGKFKEVTPYAPAAGGRWPANVALDHSQAAELDKQSGDRPGMASQNDHVSQPDSSTWFGQFKSQIKAGGHREGFNDHGGASRFFPTFKYQAKAPKRERPVVDGVAHPTVKPLALMRWLARLVTPPGGTILDPFAGSGTTVEAALQEGFRVIAIEREAEYIPLIEARLARVTLTN